MMTFIAWAVFVIAVVAIAAALLAIGYAVGFRRGKQQLRARLEAVGSRFANEL